MPSALKAPLLVSLFAVGMVAGCGKGEPLPPDRSLAAAFVNDSCAAHTKSAACLADAAHDCEWLAIEASACPAGATCPTGACVSPDPCVGLNNEKGCLADTRCAWSAAKTGAEAVTLCPIGGDCGAAGFCHLRDVSGGGCACLRPLACPADTDCPAVQCDCAPPSGGGGGTCACSCPECPPGTACAPCQCDCGSGGGSCGGGGSGGSGGGTCTCACTDCYGPNCPPCECACGDGVTSAGGTGTASGGIVRAALVAPGASPPQADIAPAPCSCGACPAGVACGACDCPVVIDPCAQLTSESSCTNHNAERCLWYSYGFACGDAPCVNGYCYTDRTPIDPCAGHADAQSCKTDVANSCGWVALDIQCITTPCPTGSCLQMKPVPGGGCACACPTCVEGESCPPCACDCCGA